MVFCLFQRDVSNNVAIRLCVRGYLFTKVTKYQIFTGEGAKGAISLAPSPLLALSPSQNSFSWHPHPIWSWLPRKFSRMRSMNGRLIDL